MNIPTMSHCKALRASALRLLVLTMLTVSACAETVGDPMLTGERIDALNGAWLNVGALDVSAPAELRQNYGVALERLTRYTQVDGQQRVAVRIKWLSEIDLSAAVSSQLARPESFWLQVNAEQASVTIVANSGLGAVQGVNRLAQLLRRDAGRVQAGELLDWPALATRGVHLTLRSVTVPMIQRTLDDASLVGMNMWLFQMADVFRLDSPAVKPRRDALRKQQLKAVVAYARESGMRVIPEVKLLTHQEKFFGEQHPELMYNQRTYDPRNDAVYELAFGYLDEVIATIQPDAIHIGHDEVKGFKKRQRKKIFKPGEVALPAELFLQDVKRVHAYLTERNIEVWMWGDMLLNDAEFPTMNKRTMHGHEGYAALRPQLPKPIVIVDWHYIDEQSDYPSMDAFADEGYRVVGAAWKRPVTTRNFTAYAAANTDVAEGMIATTWYHLRRREWDEMEKIIRVSGDAFWYGK